MSIVIGVYQGDVDDKPSGVLFMTWGISMEQDAAEIIKFCSEHNLKTIHCSYNPKKGWSVSQVYYDKEKAPKEWLTPRPSTKKENEVNNADYIQCKHTGSNLCNCKDCDCLTADKCVADKHWCCK